MTEPHRIPADQAERTACLDVRRSFIVQAPAGSGKTTLLTERFIALLSVVESPSEIVAITFTRKAAAEMRERVLLALQKAKLDDPDDAAGRAVQHHLETSNTDLRTAPERIRVMTFDRLFLNLARQAPLTSGIGPETAPSANANAYMRDAAMAALQSPSHKNEAAELLQHLDADFGQAVEAIASLLATRDQWLSMVLDQSSAAPEVLRETVHAIVTEHVQQLRATVCSHIPSAQMASGMKAARFAHDVLAGETLFGDGLPAAEIAALPEWDALLHLVLTNTNTVRRRLSVNEGFPPSAKTEKAAFSEFLRCIESAPKVQKALVALRALPNVDSASETWQRLASTFELLRLASGHLQMTFSDHRVTDFIAPAQATVSALNDDQSVLPAFVAETMRHVLVDEFQDTSRTQFNFLHGVARAWAQRGTGEETFFCVGDPMQSIYRFRQTDVALFTRAQREGIGRFTLTPITLTTNFRSTPEVVRWVNATVGPQFELQSSATAATVNYAPSVAHSLAHHETPTTTSAVQVRGFETQQDEITAVVDYVQSWCARAPEKATLGILVQAAGHGEQIAAALAHAGVHDVNAEALRKVTALPWLHDLLTLVYAFTETEDRLSVLAVLRAPWCGLTLPDLTSIAHACSAEAGADPWNILRDSAMHAALSEDGRIRLVALMTALDPALRARGHRDIARCVRVAWSRLNAAACYVTEIDATLFTQVIHCLRTHTARGVVLDRAQLLTDLRALVLPNAGASRVQVMTVHKAKGLEFDAVVVPLAAKRTKRDTRPLVRFADFEPRALAVVRPQDAHDPAAAVYDWLNGMQENNALAERVRLMYVAATRAKSELLITGSKLFTTKDAPSSMSHTLWGALAPEFSPERVEMPAASSAQSAPKVQKEPSPLLRCEIVAIATPPSFVKMHPPSAIERERVFARAFGVVAHAWLGAHGPRGVWSAHAAAWAAEAFAEQSVFGEPQRRGIAQLEQLIARVRTCPHAQLIWADDHRAEFDEWPLAVALPETGDMQQLRPDRVYQTAAGELWVVDYKTSAPENENPETIAAFVQAEKETYADAMQRYADAVLATGRIETDQPIRRALYFPLLSVLGVYGA